MLDCVIVGGGPAGMNAALVLGRARRRVILFDNNAPRNAVTQESHGFITRDGATPAEFRRLGQEDISKYASVEIRQEKVTDIVNGEAMFTLTTENGAMVQARRLILATGLKEQLPAVAGIREYYGISLYSCPYCDGWELKDRPLIVISESTHALHMVKIVYNWTKDVVLATNGASTLSDDQRKILNDKGIRYFEQRIEALIGEGGQLREVQFADGTTIGRVGGFVTPLWSQAAAFAQQLGCEMSDSGGVIGDSLGRTGIERLYVAGDASNIAPSQLIIAAADGSKAAIGVNTDLTDEEF